MTPLSSEVTKASGSIALFSAQYPPHMGGIENFTQSAARALARRDNRVVVVTNDTEGLGAGWSDEGGVEVLRLPCVPLVSGRLPLPRAGAECRRLLGELRARDVDGVLVNARFYPHSILGMRFARERGLQPVVLDHGSAWLSFSNPALDPCVRLYERLMTAWGRRYRPAYYGISQKSVAWLGELGIRAVGIISNAIDATEFRVLSSGRDFRSELGVGKDAFVVAFVGRLIPEKGVAAVIEASRAEELRRRGVVFVLAGDGPLADEVRAVEGPGLQWVGPLGRPDVSALLQQADVLCLPSRSEGFATTLLEAAACGCPSVVTDVGGARELIPDARYGTIISSATAEEIVRALTCLGVEGSPDKIQSTQERQELVERSFTWDKTAAAIERAVLGGAAGRENSR